MIRRGRNAVAERAFWISGSLVMMAMRRAVFLAFGLAWTASFACGTDALAASPVAPPFPTADPAAWIGTPHSFATLHGKVVLLDVWTFG